MIKDVDYLHLWSKQGASASLFQSLNLTCCPESGHFGNEVKIRFMKDNKKLLLCPFVQISRLYLKHLLTYGHQSILFGKFEL